MILHKQQRPNVNKLDSIESFPLEAKDLIKQYLLVEKDYRYALREMSAKLENLDDYCQLTFSHNPIHHIESRIKTPINILEKIYRRGYEVNMDTLYELIYDIAGIRVICNYISDIHNIIELLLQQQDLTVRIKKDYISNPKVSGYRSIHIVFDVEMYIDRRIKKVPAAKRQEPFFTSQKDAFDLCHCCSTVGNRNSLCG
ncbi:MAG: hypothetical protein IJA65_01755, partial [Acholeplasmatales bacterium]|nr:hypothetical protein [Acholeplasmatales bacterium]